MNLSENLSFAFAVCADVKERKECVPRQLTFLDGALSFFIFVRWLDEDLFVIFCQY